MRQGWRQLCFVEGSWLMPRFMLKRNKFESSWDGKWKGQKRAIFHPQRMLPSFCKLRFYLMPGLTAFLLLSEHDRSHIRLFEDCRSAVLCKLWACDLHDCFFVWFRKHIFHSVLNCLNHSFQHSPIQTIKLWPDTHTGLSLRKFRLGCLPDLNLIALIMASYISLNGH